MLFFAFLETQSHHLAQADHKLKISPGSLPNARTWQMSPCLALRYCFLIYKCFILKKINSSQHINFEGNSDTGDEYFSNISLLL